MLVCWRAVCRSHAPKCPPTARFPSVFFLLAAKECCNTVVDKKTGWVAVGHSFSAGYMWAAVIRRDPIRRGQPIWAAKILGCVQL